MLDIVESYLREFVAPQASAIDSDANALRAALKGLGSRYALALRVPQAWGGAELSEEIFRSFQEMVARYSGALAFLQTQHQSAAAMLAQSENDSLKRQYLPYMGSGQVLVGVGFSHLRRQGTPTVKAYPVEGGYQLDGEVPWVTGGGFFQDFIVAAVLADGRSVFGVVPFENTSQEGGGLIELSAPMPLAAIASTNTVTAQLNGFILFDERVVFVKPVGWIHENDRKNVLHQGFFALGCARAGLDILDAVSKTKSLPFITEAFKSLNQELAAGRAVMIQDTQHQTLTVAEKLQLRAWAIDLAVRCAHAAVTVAGGAANHRSSAAQRVYREALVFTVSGQTTAVMEATLARLVRSC
jgi:alkylation response protein AidB-like acyl-CoA dehydrogenase